MRTIQQIRDGICGMYAAEAIFFFFKVGEAMLDPSVRLYIYQSVCLMEYPSNTSICTHLHQNIEQENHVQQVAAYYIMASKVLLNSPVIILGLFCGAWSDYIGRKLPVTMACMGAIFAVIFYMASMIQQVPVLPLVLAGSALRGLFGKSAVVTMALNSYITDISTKEERTERLGVLLGMNFLGYFTGSLLTGILLEKFTFNVIFCVVVVLYGLCVLIALSCMRDSLTTDNADHFLKSALRNPFKIKHIHESFDVVLRPRMDHERLYLWVFFFYIMVHQLTKSGEVDITLLYTQKAPLNWSKSMYGYFLAADYASLGFSVLCLLPIIVHFFRPHDLCLVAIGLAFRIMRLTILTFSNHTWLVFLSVFVGCLSGIIVSSAKSIISKIISDDEIGKVFSLLSCLESISNLVGTVIFTNVYAATASTLFPGFTFSLDALFHFLILASSLVLWQDMKKGSKYYLLDQVSAVKTYGSSKDTPTVAEAIGNHEKGTENKGFTLSNEELQETNDTHTVPNDKLESERELTPLSEESETQPMKQEIETGKQ